MKQVGVALIQVEEPLYNTSNITSSIVLTTPPISANLRLLLPMMKTPEKVDAGRGVGVTLIEVEEPLYNASNVVYPWS